MSTLFNHIEARYDRITDIRRRVLYSLIALVALIANLAAVVSMLEFNVKNSDDLIWSTRLRNGDTALIVAMVNKGGRAEEAGIKQGDRVLAINGIPVNSNINYA